MLKNLLLLIIFFLSTNFSHSQWISLSSGTNSNLNSVFFINSESGFACGNNLILKTSTGGNSWEQTSVSAELKSLFFINSSTGFAAGSGGKLYRSTDTGGSWLNIPLSKNQNLTSVNFLNETGIITASGGMIFKSTDNGNSWTTISVNPSVDFFSSQIFDQNNFITVGSNGSIFKTADGGQSWMDLSFGMVNPFFTVQFPNYNTGWVIGCCGMYFKTINGGISWTPEYYLTEGFTINSSDFINDNSGWIAADAGLIYRTTNEGNVWYETESNTGDDLKSIFMLNENTGYACGVFGTILKTTNGGGFGNPIGISGSSENIPQHFILYQNYPNPFNPSTVINFEMKASGFAEISLYDIRGEKIKDLAKGNFPAGQSSIRFFANDLPGGIYFYRLSVNGSSLTRKMILLK